MKVELGKDGTLLVSAENNVEAYALSCWEAKRRNGSGRAALEISAGGPFYSAAEVDHLLASLTDRTKKFCQVSAKHPEKVDEFLKSLEEKPEIPVL